jgi:hypothetical protein
MRTPLFFQSCFALICWVNHTPTHAQAQTPATHENASLTIERTAIRAAAQSFCAELRREPIQGLPTDAQLQRLSPFITPELVALFKRARILQQEQMKRHPDEKPYWIEGDLFSSLVEGVSSWKLGEVFTAPTVDATVKVIQTYSEPNPEPVTWTDTLVFKQRGQIWLLDDIRMGGEWAFKSGSSLRSQLPGGAQEGQDHQSLDERWQVKFTRDGDAVGQITIQPTDKSSEPQTLFGVGDDDYCVMPTWIVWSPNEDRIAVRLGDGHRFTRTLVFQLEGKTWQPMRLPEFYPEEKETLLRHGFRERYCLMDAERWQDANTLVIKYFGSFEKGDEGDGFHKYVSVRFDSKGNAKVVEAVDVPAEE